ncbi:hypothetical protein MRB53_027653 [Persea americana]|uniref:Uncharacterized protein n=1 Tax=Persea americana TaxID=3435 RepID=A0ACC2LLI2_PERAE|nr:hypothetical protein MRB53_027653 [Persea americana]
MRTERGPDFCCSRRRVVTGEERSRGDLVSPEKKIARTTEKDSRKGPVDVNAAITPPPVAGLLAAVAACHRRRGVAAAIAGVAVPLTWKKNSGTPSVAEQNG